MPNKYQRTNLEDLEQVIDDELITSDEQKQVNVIISERSKAKVNQQFALVFLENLKQLLVREKLTLTELKVLTSIATFAEYQNVYKISQKTIAKDIEIDPAVVSRSIKKLKEKKLLIEDKEKLIEYINPNLFLKGSISDFKRTDQYKNLNLHYENSDLLKRAF